jgi:hypothetical protein
MQHLPGAHFPLQSGDGLPLDSTKLQLFLELTDIDDSREKVGLSTPIAVESCKPPVPLPFGGLGLLEVANDREFFRWKEAIVDDGIVLPAVLGTGNIIVGLFDELGAVFKIQTRPLNVVEFKAIVLEDATDTSSLDAQEGSKKNMEASSKNTKERGAAVRQGCVEKKTR